MSDRLDYALQTDYISDIPLPERMASATGITQYMNYQLADSVDLGLRFEWLGFLDDWQFYDLSVGLRAEVTPNLLVRPEVRWDYLDEVLGGLGDSTTFGIDAILSY
ncbi:MAG: outer membrane beta-barrel protein [Planctomycetaceae bacterium]|nr:outer membrane beta-barrel protein [Planctomycetaceae bacterium]